MGLCCDDGWQDDRMAQVTTDDTPTSGFAMEMLTRATVTSQFLKSVSHPSRLVLLCRLAEGPATVGEMEGMLGLPQAEVSKQLARLRADGLVTTRRDGRNITYSVAEARTVRLVKLLHAEFCATDAGYSPSNR